MATNFGVELEKIAKLVEPEECAISDAALAIAEESLSEIDARYGLESARPLSYHNADHSLGVTRRIVRLTNLVYPYIYKRYQPDIYDLGFIAGSTHDYEQDLDSFANESASADKAIEKAKASGEPRFSTDFFIDRLYEAILSTEVDVTENNEIVQTSIHYGRHDPLKFIVSFADINGIAMEGTKRMMRDATNLCYERFGEPSIDQLYNFLVFQAGFLRQRLNDGRVKSDLAYYFPNDLEEVYQTMRKAYRQNILSAYNLAVLLDKHGELRQSIGILTKSASLVDRRLLGDFIGQLLHRKLTPDT